MEGNSTDHKEKLGSQVSQSILSDEIDLEAKKKRLQNILSDEIDLEAKKKRLQNNLLEEEIKRVFEAMVKNVRANPGYFELSDEGESDDDEVPAFSSPDNSSATVSDTEDAAAEPGVLNTCDVYDDDVPRVRHMGSIPSGPSKRTIEVQALSGETCAVETRWPETVKNVKAKTCEKLRLSDKNYTLVHNGKELNDMTYFHDLYTFSGSKLQLLPRTGSVEIKVHALNGETCTVEASRLETAKDVKTKACEKLRLSNDIYTLAYNGEELDVMSTLSSLEISDESEFQLLPQLGLVTIQVQALNGETCTVEAHRFETAKDVKAKACEKLRLSKERYTLVYNGKELDDMSNLPSIDTSVECKFQLLPQTGLGLVDSVKSLFEYFRNGAHRLVEWFPDFFMDMSRALTEKDLSRISQAIGSGWKHLGAELGISQAEIEQISEDNKETSMKIFKMLRRWSIEASVNATVNTLHNAMKNCRTVTFNMKVIEPVFAGI